MNPALARQNNNINQIRKGGVKNRLPEWFKQEIPCAKTIQMKKILSDSCVHTVCCEAKCPNLSSCFKNGELTFMILGNVCTRNCLFCAVNKTNTQLPIDAEEPGRISAIVKSLGLKYAVITSVTRDDLMDGGASAFVRTIQHLRQDNPGVKIEVLIPDFLGRKECIFAVTEAKPDVIGHNLETVPSLYSVLKPKSDYNLSLDVLSEIKMLDSLMITKSSLMLGLGEGESEVAQSMRDLRKAGCDILILGQYLAPSERHYQVKEFISLEKFKSYENIGMSLGFKKVFSAPLARSSFQARKIYEYL